MITTIISGGQTGADQAGLRAAAALGLRTGGWAPRGWQTLDGPAPWLAGYGLREADGDYAMRTRWNVRDSDATVRFATNFQSAGERCTYKAIERYCKPYLDVPVLMGFISPEHLERFRQFITTHNVAVLNVAGNSERTAPGIGTLVGRFLVQALREGR